MPNSARILHFPVRHSVKRASQEEAVALAVRYADPNVDWTAQEENEAFSDIEILFAISTLLYQRRDSNPKLASERATRVYRWLSATEQNPGLFDERDYLLGESALTVAESSRQLGMHSECDRWLDRAEASFRHTLNPAPKLSEVAYLRLALKYDQRRYDDVVEFAPGLAQSFAKLEMRKEFLKTRFMRAMAIKGAGDWHASHDEFTKLAAELDASRDPMLLGQVLVEIGSFQGNTGNVAQALSNYQTALGLLRTVNHPMLLAHLKATVAETLFLSSRFEESLSGYRDAITDYASLGMDTQVAYVRLLLADALLIVGHYREAEWEILAALPTIEEQKMVPEGFAAVALLKESVRRRKTDPNALRELREHLQANQ